MEDEMILIGPANPELETAHRAHLPYDQSSNARTSRCSRRVIEMALGKSGHKTKDFARVMDLDRAKP